LESLHGFRVALAAGAEATTVSPSIAGVLAAIAGVLAAITALAAIGVAAGLIGVDVTAPSVSVAAAIPAAAIPAAAVAASAAILAWSASRWSSAVLAGSRHSELSTKLLRLFLVCVAKALELGLLRLFQLQVVLDGWV